MAMPAQRPTVAIPPKPQETGGGAKLTPARASEGVLGVGRGTILVGIVGDFSTIVYPDNIGLMRTTRVESRYATMTAGILLIVLGGCAKFDMLLVVVPTPVLSASATLLLGSCSCRACRCWAA